MEYGKITNLLGNRSNKVPGFITKKWIEVHKESGTAEDRYKPSKQIRVITVMHILLLKELLLLQIQILLHMTKN